MIWKGGGGLERTLEEIIPWWENRGRVKEGDTWEQE